MCRSIDAPIHRAARRSGMGTRAGAGAPGYAWSPDSIGGGHMPVARIPASTLGTPVG
jgi:hypothetical protein